MKVKELHKLAGMDAYGVQYAHHLGMGVMGASEGISDSALFTQPRQRGHFLKVQ